MYPVFFILKAVPTSEALSILYTSSSLPCFFFFFLRVVIIVLTFCALSSIYVTDFLTMSFINYLIIAPVVDAERLKKYVVHKISNEMPEGPFCIVYMHTTVQKDDNSPGMSILRWIYEELTADIKDRLQVVYFIHPGLRSRLVFATLGRLLLSGG